MAEIDFDAVLSDLSESTGLDLKFDDNDLCQLVLDETDAVAIAKNAQDNNLLLTMVVASALPDPVDFTFLEDLLDFSLGAGLNNSPALGRAPESGALVAYQQVTSSVLAEGSFTAVFEDFLSFALAMRRQLEASADPHGGDEAQGVSGSDAAMLDAGLSI